MTDSHEQLSNLSPEQRALFLLRLKKQKEQAAKEEEKAIIRQSRDSNEFPLSFAQQGIWFLEQFKEDSIEYNVAMVFSLDGKLHLSAFEKSINDLVKRHEILRTTFKVVDGQPIQVISPVQTIPLTRIDLTHLPKEEQTEKVKQLAEEEDNSPFELTRGPLIRVSLLQFEDEDHVLFLTIHHIVFDGWSRAIFNSELSALYEANVKGTTAELPDLAIQYADFSFWQSQLLDSELYAKQLSYWKERLRGAPPEIGLPSDRSRTSLEKSRADAESFYIDPALTAKIKAIRRQTGTTMFTIIFSAYALLLSRYCGHQDIVIGLPVANRKFKELERLIGMFINTIVIRVDLSGHITFLELLERVRQAAQEGFDNQEIPFQKLVEEIHPDRDLGYTPIFQVMFNLQSAPSDDLTLKGLTVSPLKLRNVIPGTNYDFTFSLDEEGDGDGIRGLAEYNADLYHPATIKRMIGNFLTLLEGCLDNPEFSVETMLILSPAERNQILVDRNQTATDYPQDKTVPELFEVQAAASPDAVAVDYEGKTLSYQQLNERANQLAHYLQARGVGPEAMVGVYMERNLEMIVGLLGILKAGGAYVPLDLDNPQPRIEFMLEDTRVPVLLSTSSLGEQLIDFTGELVCLDSDWAKIDNESTNNPVPSATADNLAYVIYTSGSTGTPKGVEVLHGGLMNLVSWHTRTYEVGPADRATHLAGLGFDASVWELWPYLASGASLYLVSDERRLAPAGLWSWMAARGITLSFLPTQLAEAALCEPIPEDLKLRVLLTGGDRLHGGLVKKPVPFRVVNHYGPTENSVVTTCTEIDVCSPETPAIGRPIDNVQIYILGKGQQPVPVGVWGELYIGGESLARGYLNQPELTAEKFIPNPFSERPVARLYRSGDLVRYRKDGQIEFQGRIDHQVKLRGFRIELGEIESALTAHEAVREAVVLLREDQSTDRCLVAYVLAEDNAVPTAAELRAFMRERLASYMVPSAFIVLDSLPLTANGKLDRDALPSPDMESTAEAEYLAPSGYLESRIAAIWRDLLGLEKVGVRANFFDLGGHSLLLSQVQARLTEEFEYKIAMLDFFQYPTIESLSRHLGGKSEQSSAVQKARARVAEVDALSASGHEDAIAIIGMAGRFPGAATVEDYWDNLANGVESIRFFSDEELRTAGISEALITDPRFVPAKGYLDEADLFDAAFFGYPPREAELIDPQQRIFLECAWEALERAGYDPARYSGLIGVYAGSTTNRYSLSLYSHPEIVHASGQLQISISSNKDFLPTRTSYKLNLRGPSVNVQTACSTSLVAIHEACKSLLARECDMALAGGISITSSRVDGYMYQEESILSPDGHCKAFSSDARGTVSGEGVGILVLKRLSEAKQDGDIVQAVIRGTAINNDGSNKVGYTAPSVEGQADVIALAQAAARVSADSIGYIETHGTGTVLGDPIEIAALGHVFGDNRDDRGPRCAIGAVKTNIGHLDAAAGVAGVIKTALSLKHGQIPPSLNYREPNPEIDFESSPFYVNTELKYWETTEDKPRRAGVSSFGIGGTNAHAVLEQAPPVKASEPGREWQLLPISAKNEAALEQSKNRIADYLDRNPDASLADVSYTLRTGRGQFECRAAAIAVDNASAAAALRGLQAGRFWSNRDVSSSPSVIFMFPGQGAQYARMGRDLYETETVFREIVDHCCTQLQRHIDIDLRNIIFARSTDDIEEIEAQLRQTLLAQCSLFVIEYALARLWMSWGIQPAAMIGHSIGEYVAACVAGVIEVDEALSLIASRGKAMQQAPRGAMLSIPQAENLVVPYLNDDLWLSVVNGDNACVVSGTTGAIDDLERRLKADGVDTVRLHTSGAFHSGLMDEVVPQLVESAARLNISTPRIPYISNVTGDWIDASQLENPKYWGEHLRQTVRFAQGVDVLLEKFEHAVFLEAGPGNTLSSLVRQNASHRKKRVEVLPSLRHPREELADGETVARALARLWLQGVDIDWRLYDQHSRRCRLELPTYPFQRQSYWVAPNANVATTQTITARQSLKNWFYVPAWRSSQMLVHAAAKELSGEWIVFANDSFSCKSIISYIKQQGGRVVAITAADHFEKLSPSNFTVNPSRKEDYELLVADDQVFSDRTEGIIHCWGISEHKGNGLSAPDNHMLLEYYSLLYTAQALIAAGKNLSFHMDVLTQHSQAVDQQDTVLPERSTMIALLNVISQENHGFQYTVYDLQDDEIETAARQQRDPEILPAELQSIFDPDRSGNENRVVAFRRNRRWLQVYDRVALDATPPGQIPVRLREKGVYLITGGLGKVGLALAEYLAREVNARLVLISRTPIPARTDWRRYLGQHDGTDKLSRIINQLQRLEASAAQVLIENADVSDLVGMQKLVDDVIARYGRIDGVIHAAGVVSGSSLEILQSLTRTDCELQFAPKIHGLIVLHQLFNDYPLDFVMPVSSLSTVLGGLGFAAYSAANQFMDSFCQQQHNQGNKHWISVNWDGWSFDEMGDEKSLPSGADSRAADSFSMTASEGQQVLAEILSSPLMPQVVVSTGDLDSRLRKWIYSAPDDTEDEVASRSSYQRPEMSTPYAEPTTEVEKSICELWQELLGVQHVGIDDDFFELGGHSLLATQLIAGLRTELALGLSLDMIFSAPTVRQLAAFVGSQQTATKSDDELDQMARQIKQMTPQQREQMLAQARKEKAQ